MLSDFKGCFKDSIADIKNLVDVNDILELFPGSVEAPPASDRAADAEDSALEEDNEPKEEGWLEYPVTCFLSSSLTHFTVEYRAPKSLSAACHRFLGRPLLKTQQVSRWDSRPLTGEQRVYAALDAHCLIGLLDIAVQKWIEKSLSTKAEAIGVSFSEIEKGEPVSGMIDSTQCYALSVANLYITI